MKNKRALVPFLLAGAFALGCDENAGGGLDAGSDPTMDGGGGGHENGGGDRDGGGGDRDGGGDDCASRAEAFCRRFEECDANKFVGFFENMSICVEVQTEACESPDAPQLVDPAACAAAQAERCEALPGLGAPDELPAACQPIPGPVERDGACGSTEQCGLEEGTRLYCRGATNPICEDGNCYPPAPESSSCTLGAFDPCDTMAGYACLHRFEHRDDMGSVDWSQRRCLRVQRGGAGDPCFDDTERQCASGLVCINERCMPVLGEGAACSPNASLCDPRQDLVCVLREGDTTHTCTRRSIFVQVGAEAGMVDGVLQRCSAYAIPSPTTPPRCELRRRLGETCSATLMNCWPGLVCEDGICQEPEPASCD